jgi:hypothetical protein
MVDVDQIEQLLKTHFGIWGTYTIDSHTGIVDVHGNVVLDYQKKVTQLPVRFGHVQGSFDCSENHLVTIEGAPVHVTEMFDCDTNKLISLKGAPLYIGGRFYCQRNPLTSLEGTPNHMERMVVSYHDNLPLLRTLQATRGVTLAGKQSDREVELQALLNSPPFKGKGKSAAISCAVALTKAGFKGNARW